MHADGGGLYLHIEPSGAKRWSFLFQFRGKRCELGLGPLLSVSLAVARTAAQEAREQVAAGKNPIDERRRQRASQGLHLFGELADQMIADLTPQWKSPVHARQWTYSLTEQAAALRPLPVAQITTDDVLAVLKPIWLAMPETGRRLRGRIERVLDGARAKGLIPRGAENPARWKGHLSILLPKRQELSRGHHAAMPYDDVRGFMADLRTSDGVSARALEFTILTVSRTSEARLTKLAEINQTNAVWTVPAERMKRKKPHRVPLCPRALEIVRELAPKASGGFLFPGAADGTALSNMAMYMLLDHHGAGAYTVHGFRSTFKDWASDCTKFPREFSESALSHAIGDAAEQAYRRGDAIDIRRELMDAWGRFCDPDQPSNVVAISA